MTTTARSTSYAETIHNPTPYTFKVQFDNVLRPCRSSGEQLLASLLQSPSPVRVQAIPRGNCGGQSGTKATRALAILIAATIVAAIVVADARPRTRAAVSSHKHWLSYAMDCKDMALVCAWSLRTRNVKKRRKFWLHRITSQRLFKGKFYSLYEDLKAQPQRFFFFRCFRMSSATFDKLLVLLGPSLTFQDTRMRKSGAPEERLSVT